MGLVVLVTGVAIAQPLPALAADSHPPLTLDLLRQRLAAPVQREGRPAIDLRYYTIDLGPDSPLTDSFYRLLSSGLQKPATTPALDLSYAIVQGDLDLQRLGQREPLYGDNLSPLLSDAGRAQLRRDRQRLLQLSRLSQSLLIQGQGSSQQIYLFKAPLVAVQTRFTGQVLGGDTFFLGRVLASGAVFKQGLSVGGARFNQAVNFSGADFRQRLQAKGSLFFEPARFDQSQLRSGATFQGAEFKADANFSRAVLAGDLNFGRVQWQGVADFARTVWQSSAFFVRSYFAKALFFTEARFDAPLVLRQTRFGEPVNLRNAMVGGEVDLGDAIFLPGAYLNVAGLEFSLEQTQILGTPGKIGRVFSVPQLAGNETLLRNLERNFRNQEQISDANSIAYTAERLRLKSWQQRLLGTNVNTASVAALVRAGFTETQAAAVVNQRQIRTFIGTEGVLSVPGVDLAAYLKVRDRIFARDTFPITRRFTLALQWLWLGALVVLSRYGTSFGLTFGLGLVAIPTFALMFWLVDRYRRRRATPILPPLAEGLWLGGGCSLLLGLGLNALLRSADYPLLTLGFLFMLLVPVPAVLIGLLIKRGRYHDLMAESYFVEDGSLRQLRLLIARLPVIPKFPFFRDRYTYLLLDRRWNWLNYLDFSLNNWLKFGFNDIRLRDEHVPGLITALVWYQWGLGLLYTALLLWTLSRTIPGLNLLIYF
ncbi:pentapeptide repeat-containing protein [Nodosilinea sp. FACHB-13]|uniref:pentapeptide repeat-containing protein n=1 Tax=Leptolyngbya subtilissima TaxID=1346803 RepID=UPI0018EFAA6B|nr:pentapeptide repeat-containing protein [Nodosilinea sp. FACHB-13]